MEDRVQPCSLCVDFSVSEEVFRSLSFYKTLRLLSPRILSSDRYSDLRIANSEAKSQMLVLTSSFESDLSGPICTKNFLLEY